ncbi:transcriptional regulator [Mycobacterium persicum]|uniref:Transcriptional regulator n=1 Tax=Mycobacterium persicum TaxID=1487726 RepID=A0A8E2ISW4_9MYCO|nr:helix-turn-helix domain-containing protein [Mycobacterium persicum]KZS83558.1 transcriptional regulator [Mycobacterium persicum]ORB97346.1 transcriptional regulator [Mycobacterium persicum]ORC08602.1 transcriptional regulator [Mycobacterium persicum]
MSNIARSVQEPTGRRRAVLRVLRASRVPLSIVAIADALEVHPNTVRFHLDALVADGQVQRVESGPRGPGRPPQMFSAVQQMDRGGTRHYRLLAEILSNGLAAEPDSRTKALAAGRAWGQRLQAPPAGSSAEKSIDHLVGVLDQLGFAPERRISDGKQQLGLRHCPFLELAETRSGVVCPIHLGLMQGALETWAAPVSVERLDAFAEPDLCLAHLSLKGAAR